MDPTKQERLRSEYRRLYGLGLVPISVIITSREQDGVLKKVANFCTQWRGVTRDNCLDCYWPEGNSIAVRTGEESGVIVLDIDNASSDGKLNGLQLHEMWSLRHGVLNTWTAKTGKNGLHLYFKFPTEANYGVNNRTGLVVEDKLYGVDIRGSGGVIFSPPSSYLAPDGTELRYEWVKSPFDTPLAEVPEWLKKVLIENDQIGNAFHPSSRPWNDGGGRHPRHNPENAQNETYTLPGSCNAPFRKYHLQDIAMCSGQQSIGLRSMLDTSDRVINEEDVTAEGLDEAAIDALMRDNDGQNAVQRDRRNAELVRYQHTIAEIKTMLASHAKHPDKTSQYDSMHRGNIFSFRVKGPRTCVYNVHHNGSNNFSLKILERDVFYYCHGSICSRLQKQHIGRLSLRAYLERAPANPVSIHDSSVIRVVDSASFILSNFAKTESCKAAAHVYAAANKGGRIMVDKNDEFWVWLGTCYQQTGLTDIRYLAAEQLEFVARAYNDRLRQVYKDELRALGEAEGCAVNPEPEAEQEGEEGRGRKRTRDSEAPQELKKPKFIDMKKLGNASFLDNTLRFVRAMLKQVDLTESLDQTPDLLSCTSGVIDLKTGELLPHHPRFLSTRQVPVAYSKQAPESTVWREFIGSIFNNDLEVISYMQMLLGYFISGDTSQSIFTVMTSPGGSGKSILVNALRETLGPIFATLHKDVILDGKQASRGAADPNLMALEGRHLAITEETGSLAKLDESVVKWLTGDSVISARDLFEKPKSFKLIAKIAICTNFPPKFDSTDWAMLRRLIYVPFPNTYVSEEKYDRTNPTHRIADVTLNDKLKTAEAKTEILWWLVQGAVTFFGAKARDGLVLHRKPQAFREAMEEYISENNPLAGWIDEACEVDKNNRDMFEQTSVLCAKYKEDTSDFRMTPAVFGRIMKKSGFPNNNNNKLYVPELGDQVRVIQEYVGWNDGVIWSCKWGRYLEGFVEGGYTRINIGGKYIFKHRFNFEIASQRIISYGMDIDHINRDKKDNSWSNLQELSWGEHNAKTRADNPHINRRSSETRGQKLIATHVETGIELQFNSQADAARELGLAQTSISVCLMGKRRRVGRYAFKLDPAYTTEQANLPGEVWRAIPDEVASSYGIRVGSLRGIRVSNLGRIQDKKGRRSYGSKKVDSPGDCYMRAINLGLLVHVLCALAFLGERPSPEHTVDHIDRRKNNNRCDNLRWSTRLEQGQNKSNNRAIHQIDMESGRVIETYSTIANAARAVSVRATGIWSVANGVTEHSGGYYWKYATLYTKQIP